MKSCLSLRKVSDLSLSLHFPSSELKTMPTPRLPGLSWSGVRSGCRNGFQPFSGEAARYCFYSRRGDATVEKLSLTRTGHEPDALYFQNDGILPRRRHTFGVGECELCDTLSANCPFFLVFQSGARGLRSAGYLTFLEPSGPSCYLVEGFPSPPHYTLRYPRKRVLSRPNMERETCTFLA